MKDYDRFITFIVFTTAGILWLNDRMPCPFIVFGYVVPCPIFSLGTIALAITLIFLIWDKFFWKVKLSPFPLIGRLFGLYNFPNLNGEWPISYESSYKYDFKKNRYVTKGVGKATIEQTYGDIFVYGNFGASSGFESFISALKRKENGKWILAYVYRNTPTDIKLKSSPSGGMHEGFCYLEISKDCKEMKGYYSNDEQRKTRGSITFKKK